MTPLEFEAQHKAIWNELDAALAWHEGAVTLHKGVDVKGWRQRAGLKRRQATQRPEPAHIAALYRQACEHLALTQSRAYPIHLTALLESLTQRAHRVIYARQDWGVARLQRFLLVDFPQAVRAHRAAMWWAAAVFVVPLLLTGWLAYADPGFVLSIHDAREAASFESMYGPGEGAMGATRGADSDWHMFGFYIYNNISVAFRCLAGGILLGLGSVFYLLQNGLLAGSLAGYLTQRGHGERFFSFVIGHGAFELTAIVIAGAVGFSIGFALIAPGRLRRLQALTAAAQRSVPLIYGLIVMLIVAAALEAFWSSARWVPSPIKFGVGAVLWLLVLYYLGWQGRPRHAN
jgi:uncharacterized membrane protein SpoIIM required for sporulation